MTTPILNKSEDHGDLDDKFVALAATNNITGLLSVNGNRVLTVADEGPGNGIDADTVY